MEQFPNSDEEIDVLNLPPRKDVHTKKKPKKTSKQNESTDNHIVEEEKENRKSSRIYRREVKKEKKVRKWNIYLLRFIVVLFLLTLIAIPFLYKEGYFQKNNLQIDSNPIGEEIHFQSERGVVP